MALVADRQADDQVREVVILGFTQFFILLSAVYLKLLARAAPPRDPFLTPLWPNFAFCSLVPLVFMRAKFEASSFNRSRDMEGHPNLKSRSRDPFMIPIDLHFFGSTACTESVCEIWRKYLLWWPIYGYFATLSIWLRNAYYRPFGKVFGDVTP